MKQLPFSLCLIVLAVADTTILWVGLSRRWLLTAFAIAYRGYSRVLCQGSLFLNHSAGDISFWTMSLVTTQRCIGVWLPTKAKWLSSSKATVLSLVSIFMMAFLKNLHFLVTEWKSGLQYVKNYTYTPGCDPLSKDYYNFLSSAWTVIDMIIGGILPSVIVSISNGLIVGKTYKGWKKIDPGISLERKTENYRSHENSPEQSTSRENNAERSNQFGNYLEVSNNRHEKLSRTQPSSKYAKQGLRRQKKIEKFISRQKMVPNGNSPRRSPIKENISGQFVEESIESTSKGSSREENGLNSKRSRKTLGQFASREKRVRSLTRMMLINSCAFSLLVLPSYIVAVPRAYAEPGTRAKDKLNYIYNITLLLWYFNPAINFYLYSFGGPLFRRELSEMICCKRRMRTGDTSSPRDDDTKGEDTRSKNF